MTLEIEVLPALSDNYVYLLHEPETGHSGVVDPAEAAPVLARLGALGRRLSLVLATHHHQDHVGGIPELKERTGCRVVGPAADSHRIPGLDQGVREGERVALGNAEAVVIETPGHTSGHISYWFAAERALFCADTLFALGCGRLFEGSADQMWSSLRKLLELPDEARVYCGHEYTLANARFAVTIDPGNAALSERAETITRLRAAGLATNPTTLGEESATNPFVRPHDPAIRQRLGLAAASDVEVFAEIRRRKDTF